MTRVELREIVSSQLDKAEDPGDCTIFEAIIGELNQAEALAEQVRDLTRALKDKAQASPSDRDAMFERAVKAETHLEMRNQQMDDLIQRTCFHGEDEKRQAIEAFEKIIQESGPSQPDYVSTLAHINAIALKCCRDLKPWDQIKTKADA